MMLDHFGIRHDSLTRYFNPSIPKEPKTSDPKLQLDTETLECSRKNSKRKPSLTTSYFILVMDQTDFFKVCTQYSVHENYTPRNNEFISFPYKFSVSFYLPFLRNNFKLR